MQESRSNRPIDGVRSCAERMRAVDIKHVARALEELQTVAGSFQAHPDGDQLSHISSQLGMLLDELRREQSSRHSGDQRLALHYAISDILLTETDFGQVAPQLLQTIGEYLSWACGAVWRVDAEAGLIQCQAIWHLPNPAATEFIEATSGKRFKPGEGLPGMVWLSGEATWITSLDQISSFPRLESALRAGWRGALAFPIRAGAEILGVVEFFSTEPYTPDRDLLQMLAVIGDQTGQFIKRQQVEAKLTITQLHLDFILQQMPAGVIIAEAPSGRLLLGNQQAEQIWRQPFLRSSSISDYEAWQGFHLDGRPYRAEEWPLARSITSGTVIIGEEIVLLRGDGTRGVARVNSAPIRDHSGVIVAGVVVFDDITAEHQAIGRAFEGAHAGAGRQCDRPSGAGCARCLRRHADAEARRADTGDDRRDRLFQRDQRSLPYHTDR
jgi:PAS domain-containing protein